MPLDVLTKLTSDFYSEHQIEEAKKLLHDKVKSTRRLKARRGNNKARNDVCDIVEVLFETTDKCPTFVAANLSDLPPISMDNVDVLHLLREIQAMKTQILLVTNNQSDLSKTVADFVCNVSTRCEHGECKGNVDKNNNNPTHPSDSNYSQGLSQSTQACALPCLRGDPTKHTVNQMVSTTDKKDDESIACLANKSSHMESDSSIEDTVMIHPIVNLSPLTQSAGTNNNTVLPQLTGAIPIKTRVFHRGGPRESTTSVSTTPNSNHTNST